METVKGSVGEPIKTMTYYLPIRIAPGATPYVIFFDWSLTKEEAIKKAEGCYMEPDAEIKIVEITLPLLKRPYPETP